MPEERIQFAHVLRGIACAIVVLEHLFGGFWVDNRIAARLINAEPLHFPTPRFAAWTAIPHFSAGDFGVALFFIISGFVIPFSLLRLSRGGFVVARLFRIWPTYAVGFALTPVALAISSRYWHKPLPFGIGTVLASPLFLRDILWLPSIDAVGWSLEVEVKFYLLCAILRTAIISGRPELFVALGGLFTVITVATQHGTIGPLLWVWRADTALMTFMFIGLIFNFHYRGKVARMPAAAAIVALLVLFLLQWRHGALPVYFPRGGLNYALALLLWTLIYRSNVRLAAGERALGRLADVSYPLYVVHAIPGLVVLQILMDTFGSPYLALGSVLALVAGISLLLHRYVELPSNRFGKACAARWFPGAITTSPTPGHQLDAVSAAAPARRRNAQ